MNKPSKASNLILFSFFLILSISAVMTELFRTPTAQKFNLDNYAFVFKKDDFKDLSKIVFKNSLGIFHLNKSKDQVISPWELKFPRDLPARKETIKSIINSLQSLKIRKIYKRDAINISNFSLNPPLMELKITDQEKNQMQIELGLVDSITNSTYIALKDQDIIYQIDSISFPLEKIDLSDFIETKIFSTPPKEIKTFKLFQRVGRTRKIRKISISKDKQNVWKNSRGQKFNSSSSIEVLNKFLNLKSTIILDEVTEKLEKKIERYTKSPLYSIIIRERKGSEIEYKVSSLITSLPGIKMEKGQYFIVKASNRKFPFLVHKDSYSIFSLRENQIQRQRI